MFFVWLIIIRLLLMEHRGTKTRRFSFLEERIINSAPLCLCVHKKSFSSYAIYRITVCRTVALHCDDYDGHQDNQCESHDEYPCRERYAQSERLQPAVHYVVCYGHRHCRAKDGDFQAGTVELPEDLPRAGSEHLAHPDFLAPVLRLENGQPEHAHQRDEDSKHVSAV